MQTRVPLQISGGYVAQNDDTTSWPTDSSDAIEWHQLTPGEHSSGRFWQQNFLIKSSDPSPYAERNVCAGSPASTIHHIRKCSVTEAHRQMQNQTFALTVENRRALLLLCTHGELQEKETCHCTSFGLKNGVCR